MQDIIQEAETTVGKLKTENGNILLKTTQIRKILAAVNAINNKVLAYQSRSGAGKEEELPEQIANEIRYLEVKLRYQCGRDKVVKDFAEKAGLFKRIPEIGNSREKYDKFAKFIEAIVAFHKFKGGRDS